VKVAVTVVSAFKVIWQVLVPLHPSPLHPVNTEPEAAEAVRITTEPVLNTAEHWLLLGLQLIPVGLLVTWPLPLPISDTVKVAVDPGTVIRPILLL
jgi:hypothetical protein